MPNRIMESRHNDKYVAQQILDYETIPSIIQIFDCCNNLEY